MARKEFLASSRRLRRKRLILKAVVVGVIFAAIFAGIVAFFRIPYFQIWKIEISGNSLVNSNDLSEWIKVKLNGKYLGFFPKANIFIIPKREILAELPQEFKRIKNISIDKKYFDTIAVKTEERINTAIYCERENCAFIDENGYVFERAPYFSGGVFVNFFDEREAAETATTTFAVNINKTLGANLLDEEEFKKIMDFARLLAKTGNGVVRVVLKKENNYEIYTKEGWKMILNNKNNPRATNLNLTTALESTIKEERKKLDYIDLRYGNKIYFKYK